MLVVKDLFNVHPNCCCSSDLNVSLQINYTCQSWRAKQNLRTSQILVHCEILCLSAIKNCKDFFEFSTLSICHEWLHNVKCLSQGVALNFAILHVQLYLRMCPRLFWCYAVESLVMKQEQGQIGCSTSCCSQSLLPHMLFWNGFCYVCFRLILLHHMSLPLSKLYWTFYSDTPKLSILIMLKDVFSYFIQTFLWAYECNSERQSSNTHL